MAGIVRWLAPHLYPQLNQPQQAALESPWLQNANLAGPQSINPADISMLGHTPDPNNPSNYFAGAPGPQPGAAMPSYLQKLLDNCKFYGAAPTGVGTGYVGLQG